jgi:hypothetical protein
MHIYDIIYGLHIFTDFKEPALNRVFQRFYQNFSGMGVIFRGLSKQPRKKGQASNYLIYLQ